MKQKNEFKNFAAILMGKLSAAAQRKKLGEKAYKARMSEKGKLGAEAKHMAVQNLNKGVK